MSVSCSSGCGKPSQGGAPSYFLAQAPNWPRVPARLLRNVCAGGLVSVTLGGDQHWPGMVHTVTGTRSRVDWLPDRSAGFSWLENSALIPLDGSQCAR